MLTAILPVRSLLAAIFVLMAGSGFLSTLISIRLERAGEGTLLIGLVATAYFAGLAIGAMQAGPLVRRVGHIRAFAAFVSVFSASTLAYAFWQQPLFWAFLRLADGFCVAGVYVCIESWLNERAEPQTRGSVLAGYMICLYLGQAAGQYLLNLDDTRPSIPFLASSVLVSLASIPVLLTHIAAPDSGDAPPFSLRRLYDTSPLGVVGSILTGMMLGAFYGLAAVSVRRIGLDMGATAMFMSAVILGGVALQWPLGHLSDRYDRRRVIVVTFAGATLVCAGLTVTQHNGVQLLGLGALFGGLTFALYPLCVAHTNDRLEADERVGATGGLVLLYSAGAALGPILGSAAMTLPFDNGLFAFITLCAASALVFGLWRQTATPPVPSETQNAYQILPRTTPVAAMLDPLGPDDIPATEDS
ncbi:MFS transporter [Novosphingobium pentaromativorans]|uniref:Major facilitator transporter n=1 Tax=Novosphingobium pentaromativorans US6-1 TaxID=1088721 RepID=G6E9I9_9SPHN|nr:MFS transporter [Novosphingobium pentaromativorans]AIT81005.1 major facilitator transporter [Novosphingobium pentaromativorans US6-1]EHJ62006.1 major facilitator transporter [Novosphingobium pentaromativorans US6-1]